MKSVTVSQLCDRFQGTAELAVIDPREEGLFTFSHLFAATNLPLSRLELTVGEAIPGKSTEIVLVDELSGAARRAGVVLDKLGYSNVAFLEGGITAWAASGLPLFSGVNVPGKAFGEHVEKTYGTPAINARDLRRRLEAGHKTLLIDTRTPQEHSDYCIPGAMLCPNGELALRTLPIAGEENTVVVTHCAGRTRSIIGAQTLRDLGVNAPVFALENGTIAWESAGYPLELGANRPFVPTDASRQAGQMAARRLAREHRVAVVDRRQLEKWQRESEGRTTYIIDVRTEDDYATGHVAGARHVPGGQLVQNVDRYVPVRNARVVLVDDDGVRALTAAAWLKRMGMPDVCAASLDSDDMTCRPSGQNTADLQPISAKQLSSALVSAETIALDVRSSLSYRRGHIRGSYFLTRENLSRDIQNLPGHKFAVLVADDEDYAALLIRDLMELGIDVRTFLTKDLHAIEEVLPLETGFSRLASPPNDRHYDAENLDAPAAKVRENRRYIDWEVALLDDIQSEPSVRYV